MFKKIWLIVILSGILAYSNALPPKKITVDEFRDRIQTSIPESDGIPSKVDLPNVVVNTDTNTVSDIDAGTLGNRPLNFNFLGSTLQNLRFINFTNILGSFNYGTLTNITFTNTQTSDPTAGLLELHGADINGMTIDERSDIEALYSEGKFNGITVNKHSRLTIARYIDAIPQVAYFDITVYGDISYSDFSYARLNFKGYAEDASFNMDDTNFTGAKGNFQIIGNGNEIQALNLNNSTFATVMWKNMNIIAESYQLNGIIWTDATFSNVIGNHIQANNSIIRSGYANNTTLTFMPTAKTHFGMNTYGTIYNYTGDGNEMFFPHITMQKSKIITGSTNDASGSGVLNMNDVTIVHTRDQNDPVEVSPAALREAMLTDMRIEEGGVLTIGDEGRRLTVDRIDLTGTEIQQGGRITLRNMNIRELDITRLRGTGTLILRNTRIKRIHGAELQRGINIVGTLTIQVIGGNIGTLRLGAAPTAPNASILVETYSGPDGQPLRAGDVNFGAGTSGPPPPGPNLRSSANAIQTNIDCNTAGYVLYSDGTWCYKRND